jgi:cold shock CspA family protein
MIAAAMHAGRSRVCGLKKTMQGTVTHYDEKRGYCLVLTDVGNIVFLPISVIKANAYHYLAVGQAVEIDFIPTALTAVTVSKI